MERRPGLSRHCIRAAPCLTPEGREMTQCPSTQTGLEKYIRDSAIQPAERLCLEGIAATVESRSKNALRDDYASLCFDLDRALGGEVGPVKELLFIQLMAKIKQFRSEYPEDSIHTTSDLSYFIKTQELTLYMPAFAQRLRGGNASPELVSSIHSRLCSDIASFDTRYIDNIVKRESSPKGANRKIKHNNINLIRSYKRQFEVDGLFTRSGIIPWPAVEREESNHGRKKHNHDRYLLINGRKIPIQIKTSADGSGYSDVVVITYHDILRAMKKMPHNHTIAWQPDRDHDEYEWPNPYRTEHTLAPSNPDPIGDMLVREEELSQQKKSDPELQYALNLASLYVIARTDEYARERGIL